MMGPLSKSVLKKKKTRACEHELSYCIRCSRLIIVASESHKMSSPRYHKHEPSSHKRCHHLIITIAAATSTILLPHHCCFTTAIVSEVHYR